MTAPLTLHDIVQPSFADNALLVVFASDDAYASYCAVAVASLIENACGTQNYDIVILEETLSAENKAMLAHLAHDTPKVSVRFFNVTELIDAYKTLFCVRGYISIATYYRFFIVKIFPLYERALYLDCDLILDRDISELAQLDFAGNLVAAVPDFMIIHRYTYEAKVYKHLNTLLKLTDSRKYFNAGVLLFNISALQEAHFLEEGFKILRETGKLQWQDQDVLNILFHNKVLLLSPKWNYLVETDAFGHNTQASLAKEYDQRYIALQNEVDTKPAIIHYGGRKKPWQDLQIFLSEHFWKYAKRTPFYEELRENVLRRLPKALVRDRRKQCFYTLMSMVTFGNSRKKYRARVHAYKAAIRASEQF